MINEKSFGFCIVIAGLVVMLFISLVSVFRYTSVGDASGIITAAGTVVGTVVGTFFGVHAGTAAGAASAQGADTARQRAEAVKDTVVGGLSKIAAATDPGSDVAMAVQELIDSIKPVV
jgi:hypothetical protein